MKKPIITILSLTILILIAWTWSSSEPATIDTTVFANCSQDSDCELVQDSYCKMTSAINSSSVADWRKVDAIQAAEMNQQNITCKPASSESLDPDNYVATCVNNQCQALFYQSDK